jgi:WD40 repeat protein
VSSVAISPDGRLLISGSYDKAIKVWSLPDGTLLKSFSGDLSDKVNSVAISPDGRLLASGGGDCTIKLWSLPDGKQLPVCLMDPAVSQSSVSGATYTRDGGTYTMPCGSPIPAGAVCTCNCVPGSVCSCVSNVCSCVSYSTHYWHPN